MSKQTKAQATAEASTTVEAPTTVDAVETIMNGSLSTSQKIRELFAHFGGTTDARAKVVKAFNERGYKSKNGHPMRYQMVRNILITPVKKG